MPITSGEVEGKHFSSKHSHGGCPSLWQYDLPTAGSSKSAHWAGTNQPAASNASLWAAINHQTASLEDMPEKACRVINRSGGSYLIHRGMRPSIWWLGLFLRAWCCLWAAHGLWQSAEAQTSADRHHLGPVWVCYLPFWPGICRFVTPLASGAGRGGRALCRVFCPWWRDAGQRGHLRMLAHRARQHPLVRCTGAGSTGTQQWQSWCHLHLAPLTGPSGPG